MPVLTEKGDKFIAGANGVVLARDPVEKLNIMAILKYSPCKVQNSMKMIYPTPVYSVA
jgi:energy-converting hydrogenase Eha subunit C